MLEFSQHIESLPQLMEAVQLRHKVISQNLANVNTPGYRRLDVEFEQQFADAISSGSGPVPGQISPQIVEDNSAALRADGNNVDVDKELGQLNKNSLLFQMYSQLLSSQFDSMRDAIDPP